jgi:succinate dehydrogenase/fumarate reductase flavoprotein subunit
MEAGSYDVVVVGLGLAGAVAALSAAEAGARVVVLEKAAAGGGNSQEAGGSLRRIADATLAAEHFAALARGQTPRDVIYAFVRGSNPAIDWLQDSLGLRTTTAAGPWQDWVYPFVAHNPFPNVPGTEGLGERLRIEHATTNHGGNALWDGVQRAVVERGLDVRYETRVVALRRSADGRVDRVDIEHDDEQSTLIAERGVILACGGFSWDRQLQQEFLGVELPAFGFPDRNTGDGLRLAQSVGAQLWHMTAVAAVLGYQIPGYPSAFRHHVYNESFIYVDQFGKRFVDELGLDNHSLPWAFRTLDPALPGYPRIPAYFIFDERARLGGPVVKDALTYHRRDWTWSDDNQAEIDKGWITRADDPRDLAISLGLRADGLTEQLERYNRNASQGLDPDFGRSAQNLRALEPPFYGVALWPCLLNTQGGPRRGARSEILDYQGQQIPGLYSAGELGSIWTDLYPGGCNLIEAIVSGRVAGQVVAAAS